MPLDRKWSHIAMSTTTQNKWTAPSLQPSFDSKQLYADPSSVQCGVGHVVHTLQCSIVTQSNWRVGTLDPLAPLAQNYFLLITIFCSKLFSLQPHFFFQIIFCLFSACVSFFPPQILRSLQYVRLVFPAPALVMLSVAGTHANVCALNTTSNTY